MVANANGNGSTAAGGKTEKDLRIELAAAYNILDYLNLGEGVLESANPWRLFVLHLIEIRLAN